MRILLSAAAFLALAAPACRAVLRPEDDRPFVAIAGGSGVAGMLSIIDAAQARSRFARHLCRIIFGLRTMASGYLLDRLSDAVRRSGGDFKATIALSDETPDPEFAAIYPELDFTTGFAHDVLRANLASAFAAKPIYFVAGPPAMVDATMRMLVVDAKVSPSEIRYDRFG